MSEIESLRADLRRLTARVSAEAHAERYALAALVVSVDALGAVNGGGFARFLKGRSMVEDGEWRGDRAVLFRLGRMIEELLERPADPARPALAVIEGGKSA